MKTGSKLLLGAAIIFGSVFAQQANAQTPGPTQTIFAYPCVGCSTYGALSSGANQKFNSTPSLPDGAVLMMISTTGNSAGYFRVSSYRMCSIPSYPYYTYCSSGGTLVRYVSAVTLTDAEAKELDEALIAKTIGQVTIPAAFGTSAHGAIAEDINTGLRNAVPISFRVSGFFIPLNGKPVRVHPGLTEIDVVFPDGTKVTMRLGLDPRASIAWIFVRAVDANGNSISLPHGGGSSSSSSGGGSGTPLPPPPRQPDPQFYCQVEVIAQGCILPVGSGQDCPTSGGKVDIYLRPCGP